MIDTNGVEIVRGLQRLGFKSHDSDASVQVLIPIRGGGYLRLGVTDEDVTDTQGLWFDVLKTTSLEE